MGTNFYWESTCPNCKYQPQLHIGKSSFGWPFVFHVIPEKNILGLYDWLTFFSENKGRIVDEYDVEHSVEELTTLVVSKRIHIHASHVREVLNTYPRHFEEDLNHDLLSHGDFS